MSITSKFHSASDASSKREKRALDLVKEDVKKLEIEPRYFLQVLQYVFKVRVDTALMS